MFRRSANSFPASSSDSWSGIGAPRNTPAEIIDRLNREINACLADPRLKQRITELGDAVFASSPGEFKTFVAGYTENGPR